MHRRWTICAAVFSLLAPLVSPSVGWYDSTALAQVFRQPTAAHHVARTHRHRRSQEARVNQPGGAKAANPAASSEQQPPPRTPFTAAEDADAVIPGIPEARFWADSLGDFTNALPSKPGPWLVLSSGGSDGAFGAGLLAGLSAAGQRPDYSVVTGVSTGALMAPFVFAGARYDDTLRETYTNVSAADIFEAGHNGESFVDTWPLRDVIAKKVTPELLADVAAAHREGRRLFIISTDLDTERSVIWNMGAIAAHGGEDALKLFRTVLLASAAVPGAFPPVLIDVESGGKRFAEMHVDGGIGGQFFVAPAALMATNSDYRLPATQLYIVVNTGLAPQFDVVDRFVPNILSQAVSAAVKVDTRMMISLAYAAAKRSNVGFNVATIPASFNAPSKGPFDPDYMRPLFQTGYEMGRSAKPFSNEPPPYPSGPRTPSHIERTGAN